MKKILQCPLLLIGNILQQLYNTMDAFILGHFAGSSEVAAIGIAGSVMNLFLFLITGLHQSSLYIGKLLVQGAVNTGGVDMILAYTATTRIEGFANSFGDSGCSATSHIALRVLLSWILISKMGLAAVALATGLGWLFVNIFWATKKSRMTQTGSSGI